MKIKGLKIFFFCLSLVTAAFYLHSQETNINSSSNFLKFFPDTAFATFVAEKLNKEITDQVTLKELASIQGDFDIGVVPVSSLKGIGYLTGIDTFHCYKNNVTEIPPEIGKLTNLKYLDLCKTFELQKIPKEIGLLKNLRMIRLSLTEVNSIPKEIGNLSKLERLWICCNNLTLLPPEIGKLTSLSELDIHSNKLTVLPSEICNLASLTYLDISHCGLKKLPDNIGNLVKLQTLNLFNNDLMYLPKTIVKLNNLSDLDIYDNFHLSESYKNYLPKLLKDKMSKK